MNSYEQEELLERLRVMRTREVSEYAVPDYLADGWQRTLRDAAGDVEEAAAPATSTVDEPWRGRVCALCFGIVDRFGASIAAPVPTAPARHDPPG